MYEGCDYFDQSIIIGVDSAIEKNEKPNEKNAIHGIVDMYGNINFYYYGRFI
jgi:hypothetical protein